MFRGTGSLITHRGTDYSALIHGSGSSHQVTLTELFGGKQKQKLETKQRRWRSWKPYLLTRIWKVFLSHTVGLCWARGRVREGRGTCQDLLLYEWNETAKVARPTSWPYRPAHRISFHSPRPPSSVCTGSLKGPSSYQRTLNPVCIKGPCGGKYSQVPLGLNKSGPEVVLSSLHGPWAVSYFCFPLGIWFLLSFSHSQTFSVCQGTPAWKPGLFVSQPHCLGW